MSLPRSAMENANNGPYSFAENAYTPCLIFCSMHCIVSDFIEPFLRPYMGVIPNPKMAFIFPISCNLALIFPILIKYFPKCVGKGSFPKSQIKSLIVSLYPCAFVPTQASLLFSYLWFCRPLWLDSDLLVDLIRDHTQSSTLRSPLGITSRCHGLSTSPNLILCVLCI